MPTFTHAGFVVPYLEAGQGEPVVLLHSGGLSSRQWARLSVELARTHRALAPDLLGYADGSPWPAGQPFDLGQDVELAVALAELSGPAHFVGHSYGGLLALHVAMRRPELVRSLALYEPVAFGVLHAPADEEALRNLSATDPDGDFLDDATGGDERWLQRFVDYWNGPGAWLALPEPARARFRDVGRKVFLEVRSLLLDQTTYAALSGFAGAALLLSGERSPLAARRVASRLAAILPRATMQTIPGAGHMGPLTHGEIVNTAIARHVRAAASPG